MRSTVQVDAAGLVAAAGRLRAAAGELADGIEVVHPPLAADPTSVAAAARLNATASALQSAIAEQTASLQATADHLSAIAAGFDVQESVNAAAVQGLTDSGQPVGSPEALALLPAVTTDPHPPLPALTDVDGEAVARRLCAGNASAGTEFIQAWRTRAMAAGSARDAIRDVAAALPDVWEGSGAAPASGRLIRHADAFAQIAARADALAGQADYHAVSYSGAVASTPKPAEFDTVQAELQHALEANTVAPGRYTPLVSSLIARQGEMRQQAFNAQADYHEQTEAATNAEKPGQLGAQLPAMVPGLLGAVGGMVGGAMAAAAQLPQALLQTGHQLAQVATQSLSGLGVSSAPHETGSATKPLGAESPGSGSLAGPGSGATSPAGSTEATPVSPSTSSSPPPVTALPAGAPPAAPAAGGPGAVPMGMPMGMIAPAASGDAGKKTAEDKKIVVPAVPHTEPVTGRTTPERLL